MDPTPLPGTTGGYMIQAKPIKELPVLPTVTQTGPSRTQAGIIVKREFLRTVIAELAEYQPETVEGHLCHHVRHTPPPTPQE